MIDEKALFPEALVKIFDLFVQNGKEIYLVGGGVRNILLSKIPVNCDLTTNATPEEIQKITSEFDPYYENDFGTVAMKIGEEIYEITTYRNEDHYADFRHPGLVTWGKTIEEDVVRREFTISSIVIGPTEDRSDFELIDLVGGIKDFEEGIIRTVGEPEERFGEDALRMMRAIRFACTLKFAIEPKTLAAISVKSPLLSKISRERARDELFKILASDYPADGIRLLINTGLMKFVIPEVLTAKGVDQNGHHTLDVLEHMLSSLENCPSRNPVVRLATLLHDVGKPATKRLHCRKCGKTIRDTGVATTVVCSNCQTGQDRRGATTFYGHEVVGERMVGKIADDLRLSGKDKLKLTTLVRWHMFHYQREMTDAAIRRLIRNIGKENINDMMLLRIGDRKGGGSKTTSWRLMELQKRIGEQLFEPMEINDMVVNGKDVMEILQIQPGRKVGEVLKTLFEEVLEDTSKNTREYLVKRIQELRY